MTTKKVLSLLICLVMVLSLMPMAAFATGTDEGGGNTENLSVVLLRDRPTYNSAPQEPTISVTYGESTLQPGDYTVTYTRNGVVTTDLTSRGVITVTVAYNGSTASVDYTIVGKDMTIAVDSKEKTYGDDEPDLTGTVTGLQSGDSVVYSRIPGNDVGTYTISATIMRGGLDVSGNYNITSNTTGTLTINRKEVTPFLELGSYGCEYDGNAHKPTETVTADGITLTRDKDYVINYTRDGSFTDNFTDPGTIVVTAVASMDGNYTFNPASASANFTISPKNVPFTVTLSPTSGEYTGTPYNISPTVTYNDGTSNRTLVENTDYTVSYARGNLPTADFVNSGEISVIVNGKGEFAGKRGTATFTITPKKIVPDVKLAANYYPYTGAAIEPAVTVTYSEGGTAVDLQYTVEYRDNVNVGTSAKVVVKDKAGDNYSFDDVTKTFEIIEATSNNLSVTVNGGPFTYNGKAQEPSVTVKDGTTELTKDVHYTVAYSNNTAAGTARVFVSGKEGTAYAGRLGSADFPIAPKTVTPTLKLDRTSYGYTGQQLKPTVTVYDGSTVIPSGEYTVTYGTNVSGTGTVTVTDNTGGNYAFNPAAVAINFSIVSNIQYTVVLGNGGCWYRGSYYGLGFRCDGPYADFIGITIDGQPVDKSYYVASEGSTNVGLYPQLLSMLGNGTHYITFKYTSGSATGVFYVGSTAINAVMTGDDNNAGLLALVMSLGILSSVTILSVLRKRKTNV